MTELRISNTSRLAIELDSIRSSDGDEFAFPARTIVGAYAGEALAEVLLPVTHEMTERLGETNAATYLLTYHVLGMKQSITSNIERVTQDAKLNIPQRLEIANWHLHLPEGFVYTASEKTLEISAGKWLISETLIIPAGIRFNIKAGASLQLGRNANLISYSPLNALGQPDLSVDIHGSADSGGIAVLAAGKKSVLRHTHFYNLSSAHIGLWSLPGGVSFYQSPVDLSSCQFIGGHAEDQLNIIRSAFEVKECHFDRSFSDSFDIDFGTGDILNCQFSHAGNDAIDASGSRIEIKNCTIVNAGDKGVSAGESSQVNIVALTISGGRFGVVSKDLSSVQASELSIKHTEIELAAYQKKTAYGPASISAVNSDLASSPSKSLIERGSWIERDHIRADGLALNVAASIYEK